MQSILLLHGAIGSSAQMQALSARLQDNYKVHALNFTGHGNRTGTDEQFSVELFAGDVLQYMAENDIEKVSVFGYSMGGYIGMWLARHYPGQINKVITLATKYHWDETTAAKEVQMLNHEKIEAKLPAFAATLQERHAPNDWKELLEKTAAMLAGLGKGNGLGTDDYRMIAAPAMLLLGDRDKMVTLDETVAVYKALPDARLGVLPNTPHAIEQTDTVWLGSLINRFLES